MKLKHCIVSTILAAAFVALAMGCSDGDDDGDPTTLPATPTVEAATETPTPRPSPTAEGGANLPALVQEVIDLVVAGDFEAVEELFAYQRVACAVDVMGAGGPPECEADEADGTEVEVLPVSQCEGAYLRPQDVFFAFRLRDQELRVYGVYDASVVDTFPSGDYAVLFSYIRPEMPDTTLTLELFMDDAGLTGVNFGCGEDPATLIVQQGLGDAIVTSDAE